MPQTWTALPEFPVPQPQLPAELLEVLCEAATDERAAMLSLGRDGLSVVGEILKDQGTFYEMKQYPDEGRAPVPC